jgi:hypothetical protein
MSEQSSVKGYDDSAALQEMAAGVITRRFASVDEAAKAVIGEASGSNVDRLRRKYREQNWHQKGLDDYVDAEIKRRSEEVLPSVPQAAVPCTTEARRSPRVVSRCLSISKMFRGLLGGIAIAAVSALVAVLFMADLFQPSSASEDPDKVAERDRAGRYAVSSYQALYNLALDSYDDTIKRNKRYFYNQAAYDQYVADLNEKGFLAPINPNLLVYRNEMISGPNVYESLGEFGVEFTVKRFTYSAIKTREDCFRVNSFVVRNDQIALGASEFAFMGLSQMQELPSCSKDLTAVATRKPH